MLAKHNPCSSWFKRLRLPAARWDGTLRFSVDETAIHQSIGAPRRPDQHPRSQCAGESPPLVWLRWVLANWLPSCLLAGLHCHTRQRHAGQQPCPKCRRLSAPAARDTPTPDRVPVLDRGSPVSHGPRLAPPLTNSNPLSAVPRAACVLASTDYAFPSLEVRCCRSGALTSQLVALRLFLPFQKFLLAAHHHHALRPSLTPTQTSHRQRWKRRIWFLRLATAI